MARMPLQLSRFCALHMHSLGPSNRTGPVQTLDVPLPAIVLVWLSLVVQYLTPAGAASGCTTSAHIFGVGSTARNVLALSPGRQWMRAKLSAQKGADLRMREDQKSNEEHT